MTHLLRAAVLAAAVLLPLLQPALPARANASFDADSIADACETFIPTPARQDAIGTQRPVPAPANLRRHIAVRDRMRGPGRSPDFPLQRRTGPLSRLLPRPCPGLREV